MRFGLRRRRPIPPLAVDSAASRHAEPLDESVGIPAPTAEYHLGDTQSAAALMEVKGESFRYGLEDYHRE